MLASKKAQANDASPAQATAWRSIDPWLRLYEAAADDNTKEAFLHKDDTLDRPALDARNHEERPKTYHEIMADNFNDPICVYNSLCLPDLHSVFSSSIELKFENMSGPITADQVKDRLGQSRAALVAIVPKWEQSGTGFGANARPHDEPGSGLVVLQRKSCTRWEVVV